MRTVRVTGACLVGTGAELVTVEARFEKQDRERTEVVITGLPDPVIRESKGRLVCALEENGLKLANGRLFLNLVPAARRKSGEILDLPLALGASAALGHVDPALFEDTLFLGELGIDGRMHAVPGGLAVAMAARNAGLARLFAPPATAREAASVERIAVFGASHLSQVLSELCGRSPRLALVAPPPDDAPSDPKTPRLDEVRGQIVAKHALCVAAAGGHGLLFIGPPGTGKSMLARALNELQPAPSLDDRLEVTRVLSAAGRWPGGLVKERPYRAPHHTTSYAGLVGGGPNTAPGEITLAHRGVLFLDELPEFRREALEALRQPLESGVVLISRAARQTELPAQFQLVAAMNPCPCGYRGHPRIPCHCPPYAVHRYLQRVSGPLLDRIDLRVELAAPTLDELSPGPSRRRSTSVRNADTGSALRGRVLVACNRREKRQGRLENKSLGSDELDRFVPLSGLTRELLDRAIDARCLSARAVQSLRRVARTLADLDDTENVVADHVARALALRSPLV